ncbi:hypothetical protein GCM10007276_24100 [Agaricicola taiwanensis]|uniref:Uncharacterized protein n=1 Tax=Agaricicola taiwanensis TaxID=591372 RepID=A0A8J2YIT8_9RHOB|nr:hypothetical protein GCM10007276_24100 [Agaricicola taiwanensis]
MPFGQGSLCTYSGERINAHRFIGGKDMQQRWGKRRTGIAFPAAITAELRNAALAAWLFPTAGHTRTMALRAAISATGSRVASHSMLGNAAVGAGFPPHIAVVGAVHHVCLRHNKGSHVDDLRDTLASASGECA